jgi:hypothetical protein
MQKEASEKLQHCHDIAAQARNRRNLLTLVKDEYQMFC